ncbi:calcium-binding protein [Aliisedimentitalea scapharcae]|uniref:Calcium-binding protein n=1 Tax=Aliisedimentitalea scapharcae TaxID=1524259 RepID=A0ABZ2XVX3_9RHOB
MMLLASVIGLMAIGGVVLSEMDSEDETAADDSLADEENRSPDGSEDEEATAGDLLAGVGQQDGNDAGYVQTDEYDQGAAGDQTSSSDPSLASQSQPATQDTADESPDPSPVLVSGDADNNIMVGSNADDLLSGKSGDDQINGYDGDDRVWGDQGDDGLYGADGDDSLWGGGGADVLHGDAGNDQLTGNDGDDTLFGHYGDDQMVGDAGNDSAHGGQGNDTVHGGAGDDALHGNDGNDSLNGGLGADTLFGGRGDDVISGVVDHMVAGQNSDIDYLNGGDGNDVIITGAGDIVTAGSGADSIVLGDWITDDQAATIVDYNEAEDQLVMVWDSDTEADVSVQSDPDNPDLQHIVINGTMVASVHGMGNLTAQDIMLVNSATAGSLGMSA